jgi:predicted MFS family arabinose efflux permease
MNPVAQPGAPGTTAAQPAVGGLIALAVAIGVGRFVYTPILPVMIAALGLSKAAAGLIASANFAGYLAGALFATGSWLPGTRRGWLFCGLIGSAATTGAMGLGHSVAVFLVLRFIGGVASALVLVLASAVVLEHLAQRGRSDLSAVLFAGVGTGIAVSAFLVSILRAAGQDWPVLWLGSGALSLLGACFAGAMIAVEPHHHSVAARARSVALGRQLIRLAIGYGLFGFGYVITATFLVTMVRTNSVARPLEPLIWIMFGAAAAPSVLLWNRIAGRVGIPGAFAVAALTEAVGVLASVGWRTLPGMFLASVLVGGTFMGLTALGLVRARELAQDDPKRVLGLMTSTFGLGQIVGPSFAGILSDQLGSFLVPSIVAAAALVIAAVLVRGEFWRFAQ